MKPEIINTLNQISLYILPVTIAIILTFATFKKVKIYEVFTVGAKEGFGIAVKIIPFLVGILVAVSMFRASGAIEYLEILLQPLLTKFQIPADVIPLALIRPLSGSGAIGIFSEISSQYGGDSVIAKMAAIMVGCSETTFYVLTVYFGSVGITKFRHAIAAGLIADTVGMISAITISKIFFC